MQFSKSKDTFLIINMAPPLRDLVLDVGLSGEEKVSELGTVIYKRVPELKPEGSGKSWLSRPPPQPVLRLC